MLLRAPGDPAAVRYEEEHHFKEGVAHSRVSVVLHDVLAGPLSFGPQNPLMRAALPEPAPRLAFAGEPTAR